MGMLLHRHSVAVNTTMAKDVTNEVASEPTVEAVKETVETAKEEKKATGRKKKAE